MRGEVIRSEVSESLFEEWSKLHDTRGRFPFTDPLFFRAWWQHIGKPFGNKLHIVIVRQGHRLVAVAPLVVTRRVGLRTLQWAAGDDLGYCDALYESQDALDVLWETIKDSRGYDVGVIKSLHSNTDSYAYLHKFARHARKDVNYVINVRWPSSEAWIRDAFGSHARKRYKSMETRMNAEGPTIRFHVFTSGEVPLDVLSALVKQKSAWARDNKIPCMFDQSQSALAMLTAITKAATAKDMMQLAWLQSGDDIITVLFGLIYKDVNYFMFTSYNKDWHRFSPGRLLLFKLFGWGIDNGIKKFDLMRGENEYKKGIADLNQIAMADFTFARSLVGHVVEPALAKTYFKASDRKEPTPEKAK